MPGLACEGAPHARFIPYPALKDFFSQENRLLKVVREHCPQPKYDPREIARIVGQDTDGYLIGFATLIKIGAGAHIYHFTQFDDLSDSRMPFRVKPHEFPHSYVKSREAPLFDRFKLQQWVFCPDKMESRPVKQVAPERILPIILKPIGSGHSAEIRRMEIHQHYNKLETAGSTVSFSKRNASTKDDLKLTVPRSRLRISTCLRHTTH